ncbi:MAG: tetratricopeptide repeat protein [Phycisphaerae bacterium]|nr:tetratricopeptide repeat protein [Planctomycetia bacterium]MCK6465969.1 tetratricopeptide repeat protein [Phycisphaerae bacterium]MCL4718505.1 tetratricopeptide repeat protein [Phycisphaerae bacterium]NUQ09582.1 tetratricopeptide repeat protein [Phycisphaerae bacterium]
MRTLLTLACAVFLVVAAPSALARPTLPSDLERARELMAKELYAEAIAPLEKEIENNPGNEPAYLLLIEACERAGKTEQAVEMCRRLLKVSRNEETLRQARITLLRLTRRDVEERTHAVLGKTDLNDHLRIKFPTITDEQWRRLEVVEDSQYVPNAELGMNVPPFEWTTRHFRVFACNEELAKLVAENSEIYLDFMSKRLFGGREWSFRLPILVYKDEADYIGVGGAPQGSHGVTSAQFFGRSNIIMLFQLVEVQNPDRSRRTVMYKYAIDSILYHELTHAMLNEFFGLETPQWLHEAVAGRMEQTRDHYLEAARLARAVVAGEYFRLRDLFDQEGYPARVSLFYETAAIVVLYLFEAGDEAMYTFLSELGKYPRKTRHDHACAAVFGIPVEGAVEEFEKRWVQWMTRRYVKDLEPDPSEPAPKTLAVSTDAVLQPRVDEMGTFRSLSNWRDVDLNTLKGFAGVGGSVQDWQASGGRLRCDVPKGQTSFLGIRMKEVAPVVVECEVKWIGDPADGSGWIGFNQFDADKLDTQVNVMARFTDGSPHVLHCLLADELALYMDGQLVARTNAFIPSQDSRDIDYPLALVTASSLEVTKLRVAPIERFAGTPPPPPEGQDPNQPQP